MKTYGELNLKQLRDECGLDFAHFTYQPHQCSCCCGPKDLPKRYWKDGIIPEEDDYTYLLFKNAHNGSGNVKKSDVIKDKTYIEHRMPNDMMKQVIKVLKVQLGPGYRVIAPKNDHTCIEIRYREVPIAP